MSEISQVGAARFGIALEAAERGNRALALEALMSISAADFAAIRERAEAFGLSIPELDAAM